MEQKSQQAKAVHTQRRKDHVPIMKELTSYTTMLQTVQYAPERFEAQLRAIPSTQNCLGRTISQELKKVGKGSKRVGDRIDEEVSLVGQSSGTRNMGEEYIFMRDGGEEWATLKKRESVGSECLRGPFVC